MSTKDSRYDHLDGTNATTHLLNRNGNPPTISHHEYEHTPCSQLTAKEHNEKMTQYGCEHSSDAKKHWFRNLTNPSQSNELYVGGILLCTLLADTINKVSFRLMLFDMKPYSYYVNQLNSLTSIPVFYLLYRIGQHFKPLPPAEMQKVQQFPKSRFAIMAVLDALTSIGNFIVSSELPGPLTILLMQCSIPLSMGISYVYLHSRYSVRQYVGALVVMLGIAVSVYPSLKHSDSDKHDSSSSNDTSSINLTYVLLFIVAQLPQTFGNCYREKQLRQSGVNIPANYLNYWLTVFQFIATVPMIFISFAAAGMSVRDAPQNFKQGTMCWLTGDSGSDWDCSGAPLRLNVFLVANILSHVFQILTIESASAAVLTLMSALRIPAANVAFSLKSIAGDNATPIKPTDVAALVIILIGVALYKVKVATSLNVSFRRGINTGLSIFPHPADNSLEYCKDLPTGDRLRQWANTLNHLLTGKQLTNLKSINVSPSKGSYGAVN